jgi:hypothetical protein
MFSQKAQSRPDVSPLVPTEGVDAEIDVETIEDKVRLSRLRRQAYLLYAGLDDPGTDIFEDFSRLAVLERLTEVLVDKTQDA